MQVQRRGTRIKAIFCCQAANALKTGDLMIWTAFVVLPLQLAELFPATNETLGVYTSPLKAFIHAGFTHAFFTQHMQKDRETFNSPIWNLLTRVRYTIHDLKAFIHAGFRAFIFSTCFKIRSTKLVAFFAAAQRIDPKSGT